MNKNQKTLTNIRLLNPDSYLVTKHIQMIKTL